MNTNDNALHVHTDKYGGVCLSREDRETLARIEKQLSRREEQRLADVRFIARELMREERNIPLVHEALLQLRLHPQLDPLECIVKLVKLQALQIESNMRYREPMAYVLPANERSFQPLELTPGVQDIGALTGCTPESAVQIVCETCGEINAKCQCSLHEALLGRLATIYAPQCTCASLLNGHDTACPLKGTA